MGTGSTYSEPSGQDYWYELKGKKINCKPTSEPPLGFQESTPSKNLLAHRVTCNDSFSFPHQPHAGVLMPASIFAA